MLAPIIFSVFVFFVVILICLSIYYFWQRKENLKYQSQRVEQVINIQTLGYSEVSQSSVTENQEQTLRRDLRVSTIPWLNDLLQRLLKNRSDFLLTLIEQSGLKIKVGEFLLFIGLVGLIGGMLVDLFFHIPLIGLVFAILPFGLLNFLKAKRIDDFVKQLPQALDMLGSDLRAGLDVQTGLKHLAEEFPSPLGEEFGKVIIEVNLGLSLNEALQNLSARVNAMDVQILCTGIIINRELGGNLSELIGSIGETVRERFRLKGMVKALTAESQMSAYLLLSLPIGIYIMLNLIAPETYSTFVKDPMGKNILIGCVISMTIGYLMINKITKLEV
ncbi:MAG: type II secretion system F family protein [Candidatus Melainabacteria bacterium]|nr:type II secretion system F family protein [Candidatus Melainabacteria bacterium]